MGMDTGQKFLTKAEFDNFLRRLSSKNIQLTIPPAQITNIYNDVFYGDYIMRPSSRMFCAAYAYYQNILKEIGQDISFSWSGTANSNDDKHRYIRIRALNVIGSAGYGYSNNMLLTRQGHDPLFMARIKMGPDITNMRLWIGLTDTYWSGSGDDPVNRYVAMLRYSSVIGPNFYYCTKDAVNLNARDSGLAAANNQEIFLRIEANNSAGQWTFSINNAYEKTLTLWLEYSG